MRVQRIDHVHVEVSDRAISADWYEHVLGLTRHPDLASWADDPMGPLVLQGEEVFFTNMLREVLKHIFVNLHVISCDVSVLFDVVDFGREFAVTIDVDVKPENIVRVGFDFFVRYFYRIECRGCLLL